MNTDSQHTQHNIETLMNNDSQHNVDAIRKILFGQEQQALEQKIQSLTISVEQLSKSNAAMLARQEATADTFTAVKAQLSVQLETQTLQQINALTHAYDIKFNELQQQILQQQNDFNGIIKSLHQEINTNLAKYGEHVNNNINQLNQNINKFAEQNRSQMVVYDELKQKMIHQLGEVLAAFK